MGTLDDLISQFSGGQGNAPTNLSGLMPSGNLSSLFAQYGIGGNNPAPTAAPVPTTYATSDASTGNAPSNSGGGGGLLGSVVGGLVHDAGGVLGGIGKALQYPEGVVTGLAGAIPYAIGTAAGGGTPSLSHIAGTIFNPSQQAMMSDYITGNQKKGIEGLFHPNGVNSPSVTGWGINPLEAAGLGFVGDVATNPLSWIAPEISARAAAGKIAEGASGAISAVLGREVTPELLSGIANGTADFSAETPEARAAAEAIKAQADAALAANAKGGISALSPEQAGQFGIKQGLQFGQHLPGDWSIPLTSGQGPLSNISTGFHGLLSGLGEKASPLTDLFGKTPSEVRAGVRAGDFEATFAKRIGTTYSLESSSLPRAFKGVVNSVFAGHSPDEIESAISAVENQVAPETLDPKVADLASKVSDMNARFRDVMGKNGIPIQPLEGNGYVPHPINQDMRDVMTKIGLWPDRSGGTFDSTRSASFIEKGRTLYDPNTGIAAIGEDGPNSVRLTTHVGSRAEAEAWANEQIAQRVEHIDDPAWMADHHALVDQIKNGESGLFQGPADAYRSMANAMGRRIAEAHVGQKLFGIGQGILDPRFAPPAAEGQSLFGETPSAPPAGDITPPGNQPTSPLAQVAPQATGPVDLYRGQAPPLDGNLGVNSWTSDITEAQAHANAVPNGTVYHTQVSADEAATAKAEAQAAGDFGARGGQTVHHITPEAANRGVELSSAEQGQHVQAAVAREGQDVAQAAQAAVQRPPSVDPVQASQESLNTFSQNLHAAMGVPPTPQTEATISALTQADQAVGAAPMTPEGQKFADLAQQFDANNDPFGAAWAREKIVAANWDAAHTTAESNASAALDRWIAASSDPKTVERMVSLYRDQPIDYLQYKSLQPGILTPKSAIESIITAQRAPDATEIGSHWQSILKFLRGWQLATPGLGARIGLTGVYENGVANSAIKEANIGLSDYTEAGRLMLAARGGGLSAEDAATLDHASQFVGLGQATEFGGLNALGDKGFMQQQARFNPFSSRGPLQRFILSNFTNPAETVPRLAMVLNLSKNGLSDDAIAEAVARYHFDYSNLNPAEQVFRRNFMPGYNFMKNNVPLQVQTLVENPKIFARVWAAKQELEANTGKDPVTPGYFMSLLNAPIPGVTSGGGNNYLSLASGLPIGGLQIAANPINEGLAGGGTGGGMGGFGSLLGNFSPAISTPIEYMFSKQTDGIPLADNKAVSLGSLGLPSWLQSAVKYLPFTGTTPGGTNYITNKNLYIVNKFLPFFARYQQATGAAPNDMAKVISFFTGQYFSTNTSKQQSATQFFNGPASQRKTLASILKSLNRAKAGG